MAEETTIGRMVAYIGLDPKQFELGLARSREAFSSAMGQMDRIASVSRNFLTGHTVGVVMFARAAADLESKMIRLRAVTGATNDQFESMLKTSERLSSVSKLADTEILGTMAALAQRGRTIEQINSIILDGARLAKATSNDLSTATLSLDQAIRRMGGDAADTRDIVDLMAKAANSSGLDLTGLGNALRIVAPTMKAVGFGATETTAALDAMAASGMQGAQAGRMLRAVYAGLSGTNQGAAKELKALGVEARDAAGNLRPLADILSDVKTRTSDLNETDRAQALGKVFGMGSFAIPELTENLPDAMGKYAGAKGYVDQINAAQGASFSSMMQRLKKDWDDVGEGLGMVLLPNVKSVVEMLERLATSLKGMSVAQKETIAKWLETAAAFSVAAIAGDKMLGMVGGVAQGLASLRNAFGMTAGHASLLTGAVTTLGVGLGMWVAAAAKAKVENISLGESLDRLYFSWLNGTTQIYKLMDAEKELNELNRKSENAARKREEEDRERTQSADRKARMKQAQSVQDPAAKAAAVQVELDRRAKESRAAVASVPEEEAYSEAATKLNQDAYDAQKSKVKEMQEAYTARRKGIVESSMRPDLTEKRILERERQRDTHGDVPMSDLQRQRMTRQEHELELQYSQLEAQKIQLGKAEREFGQTGTVEDRQERQKLRKRAEDDQRAADDYRQQAAQQARDRQRDTQARNAQRLAESYERDRRLNPSQYAGEARDSARLAVDEMTLAQTPEGQRIVAAQRQARVDRGQATPASLPAVEARQEQLRAQSEAWMAHYGQQEEAGRRPSGGLSFVEKNREEVAKAIREGQGKYGLQMAGAGGALESATRREAQAGTIEREGANRVRAIAYQQARIPAGMRDKRSAEEVFLEEQAANQDQELSALMQQRRKLAGGIKTMREEIGDKPADKAGQAVWRKKDESLQAAELQLRNLDIRKEALFVDRDRRSKQLPESERPLLPYSPDERAELAKKSPGLRAAAEQGRSEGDVDAGLVGRRRASMRADLESAGDSRHSSRSDFSGVQDFWRQTTGKLSAASTEDQKQAEIAKNTLDTATASQAMLTYLQSQRPRDTGFPNEPD